jgi:hypothetical protein
MSLAFKNWLESKEKINLQNILDNLILFFTKGRNIYGAPEESRVIFARMKDPDENLDDAQFAAFDLLKALLGQESQHIFGMNDLDNIHVKDRKDIENMLSKRKCKPKPDNVGIIKLTNLF